MPVLDHERPDAAEVDGHQRGDRSGGGLRVQRLERAAIHHAQKKAVYDEQLRAKLAAPTAHAEGAGQGRGAPAGSPATAPAAAPQRLSQPAPVAMAVAVPVAGQGRGVPVAAPRAAEPELPQFEGHVTAPVALRRGRRRVRRHTPWIGVGVAVLALAAVVYKLRSSVEQPTAPPITAAAEPESTATEMAADTTKGRESDRQPPPPTTTAIEPPEPMVEDSAAATAANGEVSRATSPIDLLKLIDPARDAVKGNWQLTNDELLNQLIQGEATLQISTRVPEEYVLTAVVERLEGSDVELGLVVGGHQVMLAIDAYGGKYTSLYMIEGQQGSENETTHHGPVLAPEGPSTIECTVRKDRVRAACDGKVFIDWQGDPKRFSLFEAWRVPDPQALIVGASHSSVLFKKLELTPLGPQTAASESMQPPPGAAEPPPAGPPSLADLANGSERPVLGLMPRDKPPDNKALVAARVRFAQQYGQKVTRGAKNPTALEKVAEKIWNQARDGSQTADLRWLMLDYIAEPAMVQGNVGLAYRAATEVTRQFDVDLYAFKLKALEAAGKSASMPEACAIGVVQALALAERAAVEGRNDVASRALAQASLLARKTQDKELMAQTDRRKASHREQSTRHAAYKNAQVALKKTPDDRDANLAAGKYEVLVLGQWPDGLARLAAAGDPRLADIARLEAEARVDLSQWAPLATAWWQAAEAEPDDYYQGQCQLQAKYCSLRARRSGRAGGLAPELAAQLDRLPGYPMSRLRPGAAARFFDGGNFEREVRLRVDADIDFHFGEGSPDPELPPNSFSVRWTGWIKPPLAGRYALTTHSDDGVRLWIDGNKVCDNWDGVGWQEAVLELTDGPHRFVLEYAEIGNVALVELGWTLAAYPDADHAQWSPIDALYYDPDDPFGLPELK
ncbi:MAG: hypothetical protein B7Z74_00875 [Deltaproteobacteria bacterium 21-66-5]|nr:MAG: hypothetical protein B7Z74_00875 [Deltaproteobacteria bacterium 21-66-5]